MAPTKPQSTALHRAPPSHAETHSREAHVARVLKMMRQRTTVKTAVRPLYRAMDEDHRGGVSHEEFIGHMRRLGLQEPDHVLKWVAEAIDRHGEDKITLAAFGAALSPAQG